MAITSFFYHKTLRRLVVAFGTLFNGYQIEKENGTKVDVPLAWSSKQKWYTQITEDPDKENLTAMTLPRMGFIISGITPDYVRKTSSLNKIATLNALDSYKMNRIWNSVPWRVDFDVFIATKSTTEALQIVEQIVPFFTPSFNITIESLDGFGVLKDIPITLNSVTPDTDFEGQFDGNDVALWELSFSAEIDLYKNIKDAKIIKHIIIDVMIDSEGTGDEALKDRYTADINPDTAYINDEYSVLESWGLVDSDTSKLPD